MRRRSRAGGEPVKARHRKTAARKRGNAPKAVRRSGSSAVGLSEQVALFKRERDEALEQQKATADVLRVIQLIAGRVRAGFQAILEHGTRICAAKFGTLWLAEQDGLRAVAVYNPPPGFADLRRGSLRPPGAKTAVGRVLRTKKVVQIVDLEADPAYIERDPARVELVEVAGARSLSSQCSRTTFWWAQSRSTGRRCGRSQTSKLHWYKTSPPSRYRHREHAAAQRIAPAYRRSQRIAGTADGDCRCTQGHQRVTGKFETGFRHNSGERNSHLRGKVRDSGQLRR